MENEVSVQTDYDEAAILATSAEVARTTRFARRAAAVCLIAALPIGLVAFDMATPKAALASVTDSAISAASLLKGRSPGARSSQLLLTKTKSTLAASDGVGRRSRMLPTAGESSSGAQRAIPRDVTPQLTTETTSPALAPLEAGSPINVPIAQEAPVVPAGAGGPAGLPGIITPAIVDPAAIVTPTPAPTVTTPATAVPEPSTWLSMIVGFALLGAGLRRRTIRGVVA